MNVHDLRAPHARFADAAALCAFRDDAAATEQAVAKYATGGDPVALWQALARVGFDRDEIEWHVDRPGRRLAAGFVQAVDL